MSLLKVVGFEIEQQQLASRAQDARRLVEEIGDLESLQAAVRVLDALANRPR